MPSARQVAPQTGKAALKEPVSGAIIPGKSPAVAREYAVPVRHVETKTTGQADVEPKAKSHVAGESVAAVKEYAVESKQIETEATARPGGKSKVQQTAEVTKTHVPHKTFAAVKAYPVQPGEESNVRQPAEALKDLVPRIKRPPQANPERMAVEIGKPSSEAPHDLPRARTKTGAFSDGAQARAAAGGTISPADGNEVNLPSSADNLMTPPEPAISEAGKPAGFTPFVSHQTSVTGGFESSAGKGPAPSIGEQIRDSVHASLDRGDRQVVIRLQPPELGSVLVRFREQNEQIHGVLEISRSDTRHEVEQALPQVLRSLHDLGIQVRKFEVTDSGQMDKDPGRQPLHQDAWPQQQGSDRHANQAQRPNLEFRIPDSEMPPAAGMPATRIDMLA